MADATKYEENAKNSPGALETKAVGVKLLGLGLKIKEMPSDGSCLFEALSDQLKFSGHEKAGVSGQELRGLIAEYLRSHFEVFFFFLFFLFFLLFFLGFRPFHVRKRGRFDGKARI
jgi:hypothetical protein